MGMKCHLGVLQRRLRESESQGEDELPVTLETPSIYICVYPKPVRRACAHDVKPTERDPFCPTIL